MNTVNALKNLLLSWGVDWVLWLLGLLSILTLVLFVERLLYYRSSRGDVRELAGRLDEHLAKSRHDKSLELLDSARSVASSVAAAGLRLAGRGTESVREGMRSAIALERNRLQQRLNYLGTIGNNAPYIGLFGTVIGVIHAFEVLGQGHAEGGSGATQVASETVMFAVAEALVATAAGIFVAIPAVAAFNYLQRRSVEICSEAEVLSAMVLAYVSSDSESELSTGSSQGGSSEERSK